jgi:peptidoglycan hydrolase CwlO-like protein
MGEEGAAVDAYIVENAEIAGEIDSLKAQIDALMAQYEELKGNATATPPPPL